MNSPAFDAHFEQALVQSVLWSAILGILLSVLLSLFVAKRITAPLIHMKKVAEQMANGELRARTTVKGNDEIADLGGSLNHLAEQLIHQEQLRKTMTADVAHELRTPLATLKSHMEAMIDGVWMPTPERLESCYEEIERLRFLVGDLEQLTEMESPHFKLKLQEENVSAIVHRNIEASRASFDQKGVNLLFEGLTKVEATLDRQRLGQIVVNLLTNALKFTPQGGKVSVEVKEEEHAVLISISDTGIGMNEDDLRFIFERFYRVEKSRDRKSGGSGIGLTIVKKLVEAHGGTIRMESQLGKGTSVEIHLPKT
ncbi:MULTISPECIES: cell wall metabolism sensor histidine kinase WalK [unclassified Paenibacillus]|uniref:sensor histidine kinase n=1 Tax=unclassified Paenibacillus TaxID=185978 RepID=UPI0027870AC7|nr:MULTISPECIES: ATP-binding protein [unclassified Paenibacillus]MDQ0900735.1 two-component system sensor histidine kinase BaeS [Paenibacillus sp. V4I7]MDQ0920755.1 two-component system sensor histidine kinase BaeS [Paenibacillus sp. V4I5]